MRQKLRAADDGSRVFEFRGVRDSLESSGRLPRGQAVHPGIAQNTDSLTPCGQHPLSSVLETCESLHQFTNGRGRVVYRITDALQDFLLLALRNAKGGSNKRAQGLSRATMSSFP